MTTPEYLRVWRLTLVCLPALVVSTCSAPDKEGRGVQPAAVQPPVPSSNGAQPPRTMRPRDPVAAGETRVVAAASAAKPQPSKREEIARAKKLMEDGVAQYQKGHYDIAEQTLKQAMTVYPFLAKTNITLGKIFLIRGAASRDTTLIDSARLMFEMARAMDGDTREAEVLLELFQSGPE